MVSVSRIGRLGAALAVLLCLLVPAVASATVVDVSTRATGSDGGSLIAPGDTITIYETIRNTSTTDSLVNVHANLSSSTPGVSIIDGTSSYPTLGPGDTGENATGFTAHIPSDLPCGASVNFSINVTSNAGTDNVGFSLSSGIAGPAQSIPTADGPIDIPEGGVGGGAPSFVDVPTAGLIKGLAVKVDSINHADMGQISLQLMGPDGTTVTLLNKGQIPSSPPRANFTDTIFAPSGPSIATGTAPFSSTYRASGLSSFIGRDQQGSWRLTVNDGNSDGVTGVLDGWSLEINPPVCDAQAQAMFTINPSPVAVGSPASFDASSSLDPNNRVASYSWDFGDGTTGTGVTASHSYATRGQKTVLLTLKDSGGAQLATATKTLFAGVAPVAKIVATPAHASSIDVPVTLDASTSTHDPAGSIATYSWDLDGNGTYDATGPSATRNLQFTTAGTHTVRVKVTDDVGASSVATTTVVVDNTAPTASFTAPGGFVASGQTVNFDASGSSDHEGPLTYQWDFDDDGTPDTQPLTSPTTTFAYATPGTYTARLTVTDNGSPTMTDTTTRTIRVVDPPHVTLSATPNPVARNATVTFSTAGSDAAVTQWEWDLDGDGIYEAPGTAASRTSSYATFGTVNVHVRGTTAQGVSAVATVPVVVAPVAPVARLTVTPNPVQTGQTVTFDASGSSDSDGTIVSYAWDLDGNGSYERTTSGPTVTASYPNAGRLDIKLRVVDNDGAGGVVVVPLTINDPPPPPPTDGGSTGGGSTGGSTGGGSTGGGGTTPTGGSTGGSTPTGGSTGGGSGSGSGAGAGDTPKGGLTAGLSGLALQSIKLVRKKGVALVCQLDRAATCSVSLTIRSADARKLRMAAKGTKPVVIGTGKVVATKAGAAKLTVKLSSSALKKLAKVRKLVVTATGTARDGSGATVKLSRGLLLRG